MPSQACVRFVTGALGVEIAELDFFLAAAPEQRVAHGFGQLVPRRLDVETEVPRERLDQLEVIGVAPVPAANRAARERQARVDDDARRIEILLHAEAAARAARAVRVVERKEPRLEPGEAVAADRAGVAVREHAAVRARVRRGTRRAPCLAPARAPSRTIRRDAASRRAAPSGDRRRHRSSAGGAGRARVAPRVRSACRRPSHARSPGCATGRAPRRARPCGPARSARAAARSCLRAGAST